MGLIPPQKGSRIKVFQEEWRLLQSHLHACLRALMWNALSKQNNPNNKTLFFFKSRGEVVQSFHSSQTRMSFNHCWTLDILVLTNSYPKMHSALGAMNPFPPAASHRLWVLRTLIAKQSVLSGWALHTEDPSTCKLRYGHVITASELRQPAVWVKEPYLHDQCRQLESMQKTPGFC